MANVRRHAVKRFRQRVANLPTWQIKALLAELGTVPCPPDSPKQFVTAIWDGVIYEIIVYAGTVTTVLLDD